MFVLPQSSRRGDNFVVSDADIDVGNGVTTTTEAAVLIVIAEVVAKKYTQDKMLCHCEHANGYGQHYALLYTLYCGGCYGCCRWA